MLWVLSKVPWKVPKDLFLWKEGDFDSQLHGKLFFKKHISYVHSIHKHCFSARWNPSLASLLENLKKKKLKVAYSGWTSKWMP